MIEAARALPPRWPLRVGVHVGPVIAGVVDHRKYQYDVWGDTVNLASRMEEAAEPESVCVNSETWRWLQDLPRASAGVDAGEGERVPELFRVEEIVRPES